MTQVDKNIKKYWANSNISGKPPEKDYKKEMRISGIMLLIAIAILVALIVL